MPFRGLQSALEVVQHRQQLVEQLFLTKLERLFHFHFCTTTDVLHVCVQTQDFSLVTSDYSLGCSQAGGQIFGGVASFCSLLTNFLGGWILLQIRATGVSVLVEIISHRQFLLS